MGSPVGPLLANIFLSQNDSEIALHSKLYFRYVDDIVRTMIRGGENLLLQFVNTLHSNLRFTLEKETAEHGLPFFDLEPKKVGNRIVSNWYRKNTDTGIVGADFPTDILEAKSFQLVCCAMPNSVTNFPID